MPRAGEPRAASARSWVWSDALWQRAWAEGGGGEGDGRSRREQSAAGELEEEAGDEAQATEEEERRRRLPGRNEHKREVQREVRARSARSSIEMPARRHLGARIPCRLESLLLRARVRVTLTVCAPLTVVMVDFDRLRKRAPEHGCLVTGMITR